MHKIPAAGQALPHLEGKAVVVLSNNDDVGYTVAGSKVARYDNTEHGGIDPLVGEL